MKNFNTKENWDNSLMKLQDDGNWRMRRQDWRTISKDSIMIREIEDMIHKYKPELNSILEIGPGDGFLVYGLSRGLFSDKRIDVVDISEVSLKMINSHSPGVGTYMGEMERFELCKTYDVIITSQVLEHTTNIDKTVKQILKHLNPTGILIAVLPYNWGTDLQHNLNIDDTFVRMLGLMIGKMEHYDKSVQYQSKIAVIRYVQ